MRPAATGQGLRQRATKEHDTNASNKVFVIVLVIVIVLLMLIVIVIVIVALLRALPLSLSLRAWRATGDRPRSGRPTGVRCQNAAGCAHLHITPPRHSYHPAKRKGATRPSAAFLARATARRVQAR